MQSVRRSSPLPFRLVPVVGLAVAGVLLAGCGSSPNDVASGSTAAEAFGHIHALEVNPADNRLYVATHNGLFVHQDGGFERVGKGRQDMMTFTIAGPDRFLISGHPAPGTDAPAHLGLAESTDAGTSWRPLSLEGEVDFHALATDGDRVYGVDSQTGRLMMTADGKRWRTVGELPAIDVALDPANPQRLLLTGGDGGLVELDHAGKPTRVESAPSLVLLDWVNKDLVVGAGPQGALYRSADAGKSWQKAGSLPGAPQALTATRSRWYAATEAGILSSKDAGKTWSQMSSP